MLPIRTIVHPTDFSDTSALALELAYSLARDYGATLHLLHVSAPELVYGGVIGGPTPHVYRFLLRKRLKDLVPRECRIAVQPHLREGEPADEILRLARALEADVIVMGCHGRTGLRRTLMGSVAESVLREAPCPVLTIRCPTAVAEPAETEEAGLLVF